MTPLRRHLALSTDLPAVELVAVARRAEELGVEAAWVTDIRFLRDCYVLLGAIAATTTRLVLAPGVSDPFSRHPASLAAAAATLGELAPGRVILGLGAGGSGLDKIGVTRADPVRTVEAAIASMRAMLRGEQAEADTPGFRLREGKLAFGADPRIPIALVAHGPVMQRLAGRVADLAFIANYTRPEAVAWARGHLRRGRAERAERDGGPREVWRVDVCVSPDREAARDVMRRRVTALLASGYYGASFLAPLGLERFAGERTIGTADLDALVDAVAFAGTADEVTARVADAVAACGFDEICYRPYLAPGQSVRDAVELVDGALVRAAGG